MGFMAGKRALIVGLASNRSIAWGIAQAFSREGAELAFTYQNEKLQPRVEKFAAELGSKLTFPLDVGSDEEIDAVVANLGKEWDGLEVLVHSVGFAPREQLAGTYVESVTREGFQIAHDISSYSLAALAKAFLPMMENRDAAILTMTYLGAVRAVPNYNVMGLAKASLEANVRFPRRRSWAQGDSRERHLRRRHQDTGCSRHRGLSQDAVAHAGGVTDPAQCHAARCWQCGCLPVLGFAAGIAGEILYVDGGYNTIGMHLEEE